MLIIITVLTEGEVKIASTDNFKELKFSFLGKAL